MRIHKEGFATIAGTGLFLLLLNMLVMWFLPAMGTPIWVLSAVFFCFILQFFRNPVRRIPYSDDRLIYAPADGKIVVIEEVVEAEYLAKAVRQISIFMSPLNVHVNRIPVSGHIEYARYHPGQYLVAWHPKSSLLNERTTTVISTGQNQVLLRQIAGALARRIVNYVQSGDRVEQGSEMGFIKFGSRVDIMLPLSAEVLVQIGQHVKGNHTIIARFQS